MPASKPTLSTADARHAAGRSGFDAHALDGVGIELEWLVVRTASAAPEPRVDDDFVVPFDEVRDAVCAPGPLPAGGRITFEPGGQVELSSPPASSTADAISATERDATELLGRLATRGLGAVALGLDPARPRRRVLDTPRYAAMAEYFATDGAAGASMMLATAALQVNIGLGAGDEPARRWHLAHALGPVLAAAFANSPLSGHRPSGWRSTRGAIWTAIDQTRAAPVPTPIGTDPRIAWADYALDARVMLLRLGEDRYVVPPEPMTFGQWITRGHPVGFPGPDDLEYHLTTLFPPVRPRGWLELRMLDALPDPWWKVATAVIAVLLRDPEAGAALLPALAAAPADYRDAARQGLAHPELARAAATCFSVALDAFDPTDVGADTIAATVEYVDRFVARGRTPADDRLDAWRASGTLLPDAEPVRERT